MDKRLKNALWDILDIVIIPDLIDKEGDIFAIAVWKYFMGNTFDSMPVHHDERTNFSEIKKYIKEWVYSSEWNRIYDLFQFFLDIYSKKEYEIENILKMLNEVLEVEKAGYRIINNHITPITNEEEIQGIEEAINSTENNILKSVNTHLKEGLTKLSDRQNPDYRNSIKESISAVEALVNIINGDTKGTLGTSIKKLKTKINIHPALESGFNSIYGYTNDTGGIRHAMMDDGTCDFDDAKYMLVSCSAFINYLIGKASKAGILTT